MSKKRPARQRKQDKPNTRRAKSSCTQLMSVDQGPFLKKAVTRCRRLRTELNKKQAQLSKFEEEDLAAYSRWLHSTFGAELTHVRELEEESGKLDFIMHQLRMCDMLAPEHFTDVYDELIRRKEDGTLFEFVPPQPPEDEDDDEDGPEDDDNPFDKVFDEIFENMDSFLDEDEAEEMRDFFGISEEQRSSGERQAPETRARLKSTYRKLARRLHPDVSPLEPNQRDKRWQELQNAYQNSDLAALERVEAVCDMDEGGISQELGLARLNELIAYHQSHLYPIREALKEAKRHPAFIFAKEGSEVVHPQVAEELEEVQDDLESHIQWTQFTIERIKEANPPPAEQPSPERKAKKKGRPRSEAKPEPAFDPRQTNLF